MSHPASGGGVLVSIYTRTPFLCHLNQVASPHENKSFNFSCLSFSDLKPI